MGLFSAIIECIRGPCGGNEAAPALERKSSILSMSSRGSDDIAREVIQIILTAEKRGSDLRSRIEDTVDIEGWTEGIAKAILAKLKQVIDAGWKDMGSVMQDAIDSASNSAQDIFQFAADHPEATSIFCTLVALGVLILIAPWVVEALGFSQLGPVEGKNISNDCTEDVCLLNMM